MNVLNLLANLKMFEVTRWGEDSEITFSSVEQRKPATIFDGANIATSIREDVEDRHALLLDIDIPAWLIPSSTEGHSHLYVDAKIPTDKYFALLDALADAGVIQTGYAGASKARGGTALRLPWVKKPQSAAAKPPANLVDLDF